MYIKVLASSSKGNAYLVQGDRGSILLEAGLPFRQMKELLDWKMPSALFVSHEHLDHARSLKDFMKYGTHTFASRGTLAAMNIDRYHLTVRHHDQVDIGFEWTMFFFSTQHDCAEPLGVVLHHRRTGKRIVFATDTFYIGYRIPGITHYMIECNYSMDILDQNVQGGSVPASMRNRLIQSHMELGRLKEFFMANDLSKAEHVLLLHLSDGNSDTGLFKREISKVVPCQVDVAEPGMIIEL